jgi:hypothetical protein
MTKRILIAALFVSIVSLIAAVLFYKSSPPFGETVILDQSSSAAPKESYFPNGGVYRTLENESGAFEVTLKPGTHAYEHNPDYPDFVATFDSGQLCQKTCVWTAVEAGKITAPIAPSELVNFVKHAEDERTKKQNYTTSCEITFTPLDIGNYKAVHVTGYHSVSCDESSYMYLFSDQTHFFRVWNPDYFFEINSIRKIK